VSTLLQFEELAFRAALEAHPNDRNAALAFVDWLEQYGGMTSFAARREVVRIRREYVEAAELAQAVAMLRDDREFFRFATVKCRLRFAQTRSRKFTIAVIPNRKPAYFSTRPAHAVSLHDGRIRESLAADHDSDEWEVVPEENTAHVSAALVLAWFEAYKRAVQRA